MMIIKSSGAFKRGEVKRRRGLFCAGCGDPHYFQRAILVIEVREAPNLLGCVICKSKLSSRIDYMHFSVQPPEHQYSDHNRLH